MKSFIKNFKGEMFGAAAIGAAFLFLVSTQLTSACSLLDVTSCTYTFMSYILMWITYAVASIFGIFIALEAWLIGIIMNINANVLQTSFVQTGFSVSLAIANLAFVLGIIVIALATILRNSTYGIKQLLWKLVVMAILVNFGLVIMAPVFAVGNSFTQYFMNCINPTAGGCAATGSSVSNFFQFGTTFMKAFSPQNPWQIGTLSQTTTGSGSAINGAFTAGQNNGVTAMIVPLFGVGFIAIDMALIVLVLGAFMVMMTIRYLYIAILAILLPFAWASWVFPSFESHWKKWWNEFIRWTFFGPVMLFFIYLAILTIQGGTGVFSSQMLTNTYGSQVSGNSVLSALTAYASGAITPIIMSFLQEILIAGLIVGGMIAANSMGIKMAGTATSFAEKQGKKIGAATVKRGKQMTADRLRTAGRQYNPTTRETTSWLQRQGSKLQGIPILRGAGTAAANWSAPKAVHKSSEEEIKHYTESSLANLDNNGFKKLVTSPLAFANPMKAAAMAQEIAKRDMTNDPDISPLMNRFVEVAEKMGTAEAVFNNRPDLVEPREIAATATSPARMETREEAMARAVGATKGDVVNMNAELFNYVNPASAVTKLGLKDPHTGAPLTAAEAKDLIGSGILKLTPAQLGTLGSDTSKGSQERQNNLTDAIREMINTNYPLLKKPVLNPTTGAPTGKFEFDSVELRNYVAAATRAGASKNDIDGLNNLERIVKHMETSSNWASVLS